MTLPDIDIDFPDVRRDEMIRYVKDKYGQLRVAQIVTFGTLAAKRQLETLPRNGASAAKILIYFQNLSHQSLV